MDRYGVPGASADDTDAEYEIYHVSGWHMGLNVGLDSCLLFGQCTFATPGFREYHRRMQIFILLYIEAGSYIQVR